MSDGPGRVFQRETKHRRDRLVGRQMDWERKPVTYKEYPDRPRIPLPGPRGPATSLDELLRTRRSVRRFSEDPLSLEDLSYLLWACDGITRRERGHEFRTAPSAGALYPVETYVAVNDVTGVAPGIYHYSVRHHALELIRKGHLGEEVARAALDQGMCASAPAVLV